ncbi:MAG: glutamate 5-kinase, partial [Oscillospiraceae bacterium]
GKNFGDNDTLSAIVAALTGADALLILTDIDGLYTDNPRKNPTAIRIPVVECITGETKKIAGGAGSANGTGGMATKIKAAEIAVNAGIVCCILSGEKPQNLYELFDGEDIGTVFLPRKD